MSEGTKLSSKYTVGEYQELEKADPPAKAKIAKFFVERFTERYITPIEQQPDDHKHGFCTMAVSCLMIEALQQFWEGWEKTPDRGGKKAFVDFFQRCEGFVSLKDKKHAEEFYSCVRCGILHQGETKGGWTIHRGKGGTLPLLFDSKHLSINATVFHNALKVEVNDYAKILESANWNSERWEKFRKKMKSVCKNCEKA